MSIHGVALFREKWKNQRNRRLLKERLLNRIKKHKVPDRYKGKDRPGRVRSPNGPLRSSWAYPPGIAESGVGLLETIAGLVVFVVLAVICAKAFSGISAGQKETARLHAPIPAAELADETLFPSADGGAPRVNPRRRG